MPVRKSNKRWIIAQPVLLARKTTEVIRMIPEVDITDIRCSIFSGSSECYVEGFRVGSKKYKAVEPGAVFRKGQSIQLRVRNGSTQPQQFIVALRGIVVAKQKKAAKNIDPRVAASAMSNKELLEAINSCNCHSCCAALNNIAVRESYVARFVAQIQRAGL